MSARAPRQNNVCSPYILPQAVKTGRTRKSWPTAAFFVSRLSLSPRDVCNHQLYPGYFTPTLPDRTSRTNLTKKIHKLLNSKIIQNNGLLLIEFCLSRLEKSITWSFILCCCHQVLSLGGVRPDDIGGWRKTIEWDKWWRMRWCYASLPNKRSGTQMCSKILNIPR